MSLISKAPINAIVQINLGGFTFKRIEAPLEYKPVGHALTKIRRHNAEDGPAHRMAMKLGWLFQERMPRTPQLLSAYGHRVCEILSVPGVNPSGTAADGPFREHVGADCTYLWAAATSGAQSLQVHLLACMIARAWDAQIATAIWVEFVRSRQTEILELLAQNGLASVSESSVIAARQDFTSEELSRWDASARAWLAQADQAQSDKQDQLHLIIKNISLTTGSNLSAYPNVINTWTQALEIMERLFDGVSQKVCDGAVLNAISAWHLYPDLAYFGRETKSIRFRDALFVRPATLSLGLQEVSTSRDNSGIHWSLALSHLRFYGDPVRVESIQNRKRISIPHFQIVVLGAVLESWRVIPSDRLDAIRWISTLWRYLQRNKIDGVSDYQLSSCTSWLAVLAGAADSILHNSRKGGAYLLSERHDDLLNYGELHATNLLLSAPRDLQPFFGLCNPLVLAALEQPLDVDAGIQYLRNVSQRLGLRDSEAFICYSQRRKGVLYVEYGTAIAHRMKNGTFVHSRWVELKNEPVSSDTNCSHTLHRSRSCPPAPQLSDVAERINRVSEQGEICYALPERSKFYDTRPNGQETFSQGSFRISRNNAIWENPVPLFTNDAPCDGSCGACRCLMPIQDGEPSTIASFRRFIDTGTDPSLGNSTFELFIKDDVLNANAAAYQVKLSNANLHSDPLAIGIMWLKEKRPNPKRVWDYISGYGRPLDSGNVVEENSPSPVGLDWRFSRSTATRYLILDRQIQRPPRGWFRSLELCGVICQIYKNLVGATMSLDMISEKPILDWHWAKAQGSYVAAEAEQNFGVETLLKNMTREDTLSCIAAVQTGIADILPSQLSEVMAMSADNSIFCPASLLSDPIEPLNSTSMRHIVGNVGRPGLSLLISPTSDLLKVYPANLEVRHVKNGGAYNGQRDDAFVDTSLHLTLTGYKTPLVSTLVDTVDQGIYYLQAVVSLWGNGRRIADIDLLAVERNHGALTRVQFRCECSVPSVANRNFDIRGLREWQDLLSPPRRTAVMQSHGNWAARLAAVALLIQLGKDHTAVIIDPAMALCWKCLLEFFKRPEPHLPEILID